MDMEEVQQQEFELQNDEYVADSHQACYEEESTENRTINLKCQIDTEKLIRLEARKFVNTQEQCNLRKTTILKQNNEINKNMDSLRNKIKEEEKLLNENRIMASSEEKKLLENMKLTYSTREILDMLGSYIENFRQSVSTLQTSTVNIDFEKKYGSRINTIPSKAKINVDIAIPVEEYSECLLESEKLKSEIRDNEKIEKSLQDEILLREQRIKNELSVLNEDILVKEEEIRKQSEEIEKIKENNFEFELEVLETQKLQSLEMQKLLFERDTLTERLASSQARFVDVEQELEKSLVEKKNLEEQMKEFQEDLNEFPEIDLHTLENTLSSELEGQKENLIRANDELNESLKVVREKDIELIQSTCDEKIKLLNSETIIADLQNQLVESQKLYNDEGQNLNNLNQERTDMEKMLEDNSSNMEKEQKTLEVQNQTAKEIEERLEILKSDTVKQKIEFDYQEKTVLPYLETKLKDLEKKSLETEKKISEEEQKYNKLKSLKIKKIEQCNRAQRYFAMYDDSARNTKPTEPIEKESEENQEIEEKIEEEQPTDGTNTKSILKSPNSSAPQTPKKNVTFHPSLEPSNSFEASVEVNTSSQASDFFGAFEPVPYKRNRNFD